MKADFQKERKHDGADFSTSNCVYKITISFPFFTRHDPTHLGWNPKIDAREVLNCASFNTKANDPHNYTIVNVIKRTFEAREGREFSTNQKTFHFNLTEFHVSDHRSSTLMYNRSNVLQSDTKQTSIRSSGRLLTTTVSLARGLARVSCAHHIISDIGDKAVVVRTVRLRDVAQFHMPQLVR